MQIRDHVSAQIDRLCAVTRPHPATAGLAPIDQAALVRAWDRW
jgi:hypothetical protein